MTMKVLKDAGAAPPEIALFHEPAMLRRAIGTPTDATERRRLLLLSCNWHSSSKRLRFASRRCVVTHGCDHRAVRP
jgi:hypothetical protein